MKDKGTGKYGDNDNWDMRLWFNLRSGDQSRVHFMDWFGGAGAAIRYARDCSDDWQLYRRAPNHCVLAESITPQQPKVEPVKPAPVVIPSLEETKQANGKGRTFYDAH